MFSCMPVWFLTVLSPYNYLLLMSLTHMELSYQVSIPSVVIMAALSKYHSLSTYWTLVRTAFLGLRVIGWGFGLVLNEESWVEVMGVTSKIEHLSDDVRPCSHLLFSLMLAMFLIEAASSPCILEWKRHEVDSSVKHGEQAVKWDKCYL